MEWHWGLWRKDLRREHARQQRKDVEGTANRQVNSGAGTGDVRAARTWSVTPVEPAATEAIIVGIITQSTNDFARLLCKIASTFASRKGQSRDGATRVLHRGSWSIVGEAWGDV